jgi:hypothetical protein
MNAVSVVLNCGSGKDYCHSHEVKNEERKVDFTFIKLNHYYNENYVNTFFHPDGHDFLFCLLLRQ